MHPLLISKLSRDVPPPIQQSELVQYVFKQSTEGSRQRGKSWSSNMNDSESDSDRDDDHDDHQLRDDDDYDDDYIVDKLNTILQRKGEFSLRSRNKINELARQFLKNLGNDIHDMLCEDDVEADDYFGLDSNRDTEAEIETALRFFPELLSRTKLDNYGTTLNVFPIELLAYTRSGNNIGKCNLKAVSFVPLVVRLAIEFDLFEEHERGGLLIGDKYHVNMLKLLSSRKNMLASDRENHGLIDDAHLNVMVQLRQMGHFKKEDIYIHDLLMKLCVHDIFPRKRFQFLVEWYPIALIRPDEFGCVTLHRVALMCSIQAFQAVFEYGIRYYPKKKGISLLFMKNRNGETPIQIAFRKTKLRDEVMTVIEDTLTSYSSFSDNNDTSINTVEALVMAAIDENIHLDCVYFLLRRQPDVLVELLSSTPTPTPTPGEAAGSNNNNNNNNEDDDDNDYDDGGDERNDGNNDILVRRTLSSNKKRKRKL